MRWCAGLSFPVYALVIMATGLLLHRVPTAVLWVVVAFIPISNVCLGLFTCPKCREEYGGKAWPACILRCWVSTCSRCGVREGTAGDDAPKQ